MMVHFNLIAEMFAKSLKGLLHFYAIQVGHLSKEWSRPTLPNPCSIRAPNCPLFEGSSGVSYCLSHACSCLSHDPPHADGAPPSMRSHSLSQVKNTVELRNLNHTEV